jgi:ADP-ribose pyrophosphatase YjhB (NUDIX family)
MTTMIRSMTAGARAAGLGRRLLVRLWGRTPSPVRRLAIRLLVPKATYGACAVIADQRGHVLLVRHPYRGGAWGLPGGFGRRGEAPAATLAREVREELGVAAAVGPLLWADLEPATQHLTFYYRATIDGEPRPDGLEIDAARYADPAEATLAIGDAARPWLERLRAAHAA